MDDQHILNRLVNLDDPIATDRGSDYVIVNATRFDGTRSIKIDVLQQSWHFDDPFFQMLFGSITLFSFIFLISGYVKAPMRERTENTQNMSVLQEQRKSNDWRYFIYNFVDKYKDIFYAISFPHFNGYITFGLWASIFLPTILALILFVPTKFMGQMDYSTTHHSIFQRAGVCLM